MKEINVDILKPSELEEKIKETLAKPNPEPSSETKKAYKYLQGIIKNCTQFEIKLGEDAYFAHGKYGTLPPTTIAPFSVAQFSGVVTRFVAPRWVAGGNAFTLYLEKDAEIPIALGWTSPISPAVPKSAIVESKESQVGYDKTVEHGTKVNFKEEFSGGDTGGDSVTVHFRGSSTSGQRPVFTITQIVVPAHNA